MKDEPFFILFSCLVALHREWNLWFGTHPLMIEKDAQHM